MPAQTRLNRMHSPFVLSKCRTTESGWCRPGWHRMQASRSSTICTTTWVANATERRGRGPDRSCRCNPAAHTMPSKMPGRSASVLRNCAAIGARLTPHRPQFGRPADAVVGAFGILALRTRGGGARQCRSPCPCRMGCRPSSALPCNARTGTLHPQVVIGGSRLGDAPLPYSIPLRHGKQRPGPCHPAGDPVQRQPGHSRAQERAALAGEPARRRCPEPRAVSSQDPITLASPKNRPPFWRGMAQPNPLAKPGQISSHRPIRKAAA